MKKISKVEKQKFSYNRKIIINIFASLITCIIICVLIAVAFSLISNYYIKTTFNKYNLNLNETIAIYEIQKQITAYAVCAIILIIFVCAIWIFSNYILEKIEKNKVKKVLKNIENIRNRDYSFVLKDVDTTSFGKFQTDVYQTMIRIQEYALEVEKDKQKQAEYLSDISHQLRTPLLSITILTDSLLKNDIKFSEEERGLVYDISKQLEKMRWLVESLLKMAQLETKTVILKKDEIKVSELIQISIKNLEIMLELRKQKVEINGDLNAVIIGDFKWNVEAFTNIIKNASEHSKEEDTITINVKDNVLYTEISVKDEGEGISEDELPHIFERFYKGKNSNNDSFGIGLSLAKEIIVAQNGEVKVNSNVGNGTEFLVRFLK